MKKIALIWVMFSNLLFADDNNSCLYLSLDKIGSKRDYAHSEIYHAEVGVLDNQNEYISFHSVFDGRYHPGDKIKVNSVIKSQYDGLEFKDYRDVYRCCNLAPEKIIKFKGRIQEMQSNKMPLYPDQTILGFHDENINNAIKYTTSASMVLDGIFPGVLPNIYKLQKENSIDDYSSPNAVEHSMETFLKSVDGPEGLVAKGMCQKFETENIQPKKVSDIRSHYKQDFNSINKKIEDTINADQDLVRLVFNEINRSIKVCAYLIAKVPTSAVVNNIPYPNVLVENLFEIYYNSAPQSLLPLEAGQKILVKEFGRINWIPSPHIINLKIGNPYCFDLYPDREDLESQVLRSVDLDIDEQLSLPSFYKTPSYEAPILDRRRVVEY